MKFLALFSAMLFVGLCALMGCSKFLDAKTDQRLFIPTRVTDLQALLDYFPTMNKNQLFLGESCADNYYLTEDDWAKRPVYQQRQYTWEPDYIFEPYPNQWSNGYEGVFVANTVLSIGSKLSDAEKVKPEWQYVRGQALFFRARLFAEIAFVWAPAYDQVTAGVDLGIPLRLTDDINEPTVRASVAETYQRILADLTEAIQLLPEINTSATRPSRAAAYALTARVYLAMGKHDEAWKYADTAYRLSPVLLDYNQLDSDATRPFEQFNDEVLFHARTLNPSLLSNTRAKIDSTLYDSYHPSDLRKILFFRDNGNGTYGFKGNYSGTTGLFTGLANDEIYLMKAESEARHGNTTEALAVLNQLLITRWKTGMFIPYTATSPHEALDIILRERRKELVYRGLRWIDIKRLNKEGYDIELVRHLGDKRYVLPPNDLRYAIAIPEDVLTLSGIEQNIR